MACILSFLQLDLDQCLTLSTMKSQVPALSILFRGHWPLSLSLFKTFCEGGLPKKHQLNPSETSLSLLSLTGLFSL